MKKVKKACIAVALFLSVALPAIPARAEISSLIKKEQSVYWKTVKMMKKVEKAKEAYRRLLMNHLSEPEGVAGSSCDIYFACDDMNNDGVPELLLQYGSSSDEQCVQKIYVCRNKKARCIYKSTDERRIVSYYPQSGILMETGDRMGWTLIRYYKMRRKTMTPYAQAQEPDKCMASSYGGRYNIKNKSVTKSRFHKYVKKVTKRKKGKQIELIPNTEENISLNL